MAKRSMNVTEHEEGRSRFKFSKTDRKEFFIISAVILICFGIGALAIGLSQCEKKDDSPSDKVPFKNAAVASDATPCSRVGRDILEKGGSAVDAAVATQFCLGVVIPHSTGIGGGGFMVIYNRTKKSSEVFDFREVAPETASEEMFANKTGGNVSGPSIAVPGMVKGLYRAWEKHGVMKWEDLIKPAIKMAKEGVKINKALHQAMEGEKELINNDAGLKAIFMSGSSLKSTGDLIKQPNLAKTMETISKSPDSFYSGTLAAEIIKDMNKTNGLVTENDLKIYEVKDGDATTNVIGDYTMMTPPPPSSGVVMAMILNILKGYKIMPADYKDEEKAPLMYHRMVEAFKYAYARRGLLGDPAFVSNISEVVVKELLNQTLAEQLRGEISDDKTNNNETYYGGYYAKSDSGTSHTSIIGKMGDAVAVTSTINYWFGSGFLSETTGILYNNEMDDFSTPGKNNSYGYLPSKYNFIQPGKRPMSSMSPVIVTDKDGDVRLVAGASGGSRIITGTAQVMINNLWLGMNAWDAVSKPRLHHQLLPRYVQIDQDPYKMADYIVKGLEKRGHEVREMEGGVLSNTQAVTRGKDGEIYAMSDPRKHAEAAGF